MVTVPAVTPVTIPVDPTVAMAVLLLVHEPPVVVEDNGVVCPTQRLAAPVIAAGAGFTVTVVLTVQPARPYE